VWRADGAMLSTSSRLRGDNLQDLTGFRPPHVRELRDINVIADVSTDQQNLGLQSLIQYDRNTAARFGISAAAYRQHAL